MMSDGTMIDGDEYFAEETPEVEGNGDAVPTGDIDSEVTEEPVGDDLDEGEGDTPAEDEEGESDPEDAADEDEWLIEGRFKKDDVEKLAESYRELESFASRRENELREQMREEREAAFEQARKLIESQQQQVDPIQQGLQARQREEQLAQLALSDPNTAWQIAEQSGDPRLAQRVITSIHEGAEDVGVPGDPVTAQALSQRLGAVQAQSEIQQMRQELQQMRADSAIRTAYTEFEQQNADLISEDSPVRQYVAEYLQEEIKADQEAAMRGVPSRYSLDNPESVQRVLNQALEVAVGRAYREYAASQARGTSESSDPVEAAQPSPGEAKKKARLESGTPRRGSRGEVKDAGASYADELLEYAKQDAPYKFR